MNKRIPSGTVMFVAFVALWVLLLPTGSWDSLFLTFLVVIFAGVAADDLLPEETY